VPAPPKLPEAGDGGGLGIRDHLRLEFERRRTRADVNGLDRGSGPNSERLARATRIRALELHLVCLLDGPRAASAVATVNAWLAEKESDTVALEQLQERLDAIDQEER
jgi:hypothetical protein